MNSSLTNKMGKSEQTGLHICLGILLIKDDQLSHLSITRNQSRMQLEESLDDKQLKKFKIINNYKKFLPKK